jgi:RimJ/RimL family protein N-acetyltransferase
MLEDYDRVRPLFRTLDQHLAVDAILAGETPAEVFADDPIRPHAALLLPWNRHRIFLAGDAGNQRFNQALTELLARQLVPQDDPGALVELVAYYADGWEQVFDALMPGATTLTALRHVYRLQELRADWRRLLPADLTMRRVDAGLLADGGIQHLDQLITEIHSESHSVEDFLGNKFGFCVQHGRALVGWCLSEYNHGDACELGIETVEGYRQQGLGTLTAAATVEHALARGITRIGWHCWARNAASIALALKLGFVKIEEYAVRYCRLKAS